MLATSTKKLHICAFSILARVATYGQRQSELYVEMCFDIHDNISQRRSPLESACFTDPTSASVA